MRIEFRFAIVLSLALFILAASCLAQSTSRFQSVSGESARGYLGSILAEDSESAEEDEDDSGGLWDWGGAPRGRKVVDGKLVDDPYYNLSMAKITNNWLGDTYVDSATGNPIYSYVDPATGKPVYFYIDPKTGNPVYTNVDPVTGEPVYTSLSPFYSSTGGSSSNGGVVLPPVFNTNDPWA
ncbi:MAG: hypothetical protein QUS09_10740 [Methanotrichaceae archaeon]|nr:hypothetical protein [Methanotrichaceae archaeon]